MKRTHGNQGDVNDTLHLTRGGGRRYRIFKDGASFILVLILHSSRKVTTTSELGFGGLQFVGRASGETKAYSRHSPYRSKRLVAMCVVVSLSSWPVHCQRGARQCHMALLSVQPPKFVFVNNGSRPFWIDDNTNNNRT